MSISRDLGISISMEEGVELFFEGDRCVLVVTGVNYGVIGKDEQFRFYALDDLSAGSSRKIGATDAALEKRVA